MFLNLFIAVVLEGFYNSSQNENAEFNLTIALEFTNTWKKFDPQGTGFISKCKLEEFLIALGAPLGFKADIKDQTNIYKETFV